MVQRMTVLSLKTELDVAEVLLAEGWMPGEINSILAFPLPGAAFHPLGSPDKTACQNDVIPATLATPTTLHRARQLLISAGWRERELESLLKPCLYSQVPWSNHPLDWLRHEPGQGAKANWWSRPTLSLQQYRRTMASQRMISLGGVIVGVLIAVALWG